MRRFCGDDNPPWPTRYTRSVSAADSSHAPLRPVCHLQPGTATHWGAGLDRAEHVRKPGRPAQVVNEAVTAAPAIAVTAPSSAAPRQRGPSGGLRARRKYRRRRSRRRRTCSQRCHGPVRSASACVTRLPEVGQLSPWSGDLGAKPVTPALTCSFFLVVFRCVWSRLDVRRPVDGLAGILSLPLPRGRLPVVVHRGSVLPASHGSPCRLGAPDTVTMPLRRGLTPCLRPAECGRRGSGGRHRFSLRQHRGEVLFFLHAHMGDTPDRKWHVIARFRDWISGHGTTTYRS